MSTSQCDVAIIGGGHNGLVAGNYLVRRGHRVIVIEAAPALGGMTTSGHFFPEAPEHVMHPCGVSPLEWWGLGPEPYGRGVSFPVLGWAIA